tara:strand:- start:661 stop:891 length:231 start_codon:yes stop_codon:yes gene_type:complete
LSKYIVYSRNNCSYCDKTVALLEAKNIPFEIKKIDEDINLYKEMQKKAPLMKTLPVILKDGELIGGYNELFKSLES